MALTLFFIYPRRHSEPAAATYHHVKVFTFTSRLTLRGRQAAIACLLTFTSLWLTSCSSTRTVALMCKERHIEIYADDQPLGRDLVRYTVPKGQKYIEVSCRDNGVEVLHRTINVEDKNNTLIELQIPKNYRYSSKP